MSFDATLEEVIIVFVFFVFFVQLLLAVLSDGSTKFDYCNILCYLLSNLLIHTYFRYFSVFEKLLSNYECNVYFKPIVCKIYVVFSSR